MVYDITFVVLFLIIFAIITYKKNLLDFNGVLFGIIVGILTFILGGINSFIGIALFFLIVEGTTVFIRKFLLKSKKHETRTTGNILGNSGAALISLALIPGSLNIAFFGAIAGALSDTLSGEIGMLSKNKPRLITNLKEVEPGTDGGITLLGTIIALFSAMIIGIYVFYLTQNLNNLFIITIAGFIGSLVDSVLGALFERKNYLNNNSVNFLASGSAAFVAFALTMFM